MKIALIGTAPSSINKAPYNDPSWQIWGCSPGAYYLVPRSERWFETHRWEPPVIGKPDQQVSWFSPEYVQWLYHHPSVWGFNLPADMPNGHFIDHVVLRKKYGDYNFTSTIAWMFALAIEEILVDRAKRAKPALDGPVLPPPGAEPEDIVGLWGIDMAAEEEYGYQRSGCQFFAQVAQSLGIGVFSPPESDLFTPPPLYGLFECTHRGVKFRSRMAELKNREQQLVVQQARTNEELAFVRGAISDLIYMQNNWLFDGDTPCAADFTNIFGDLSKPAGE